MKVIDNGQKVRITKFFLSIMKEKFWLEEMALKGYRLCAMTMGMTYTFEKMEPTRLIYEIDRFDIPNNPTLEDINQKEEFISLATEMGWQMILHDENMNYYFCKESTNPEEDELYNDAESRRYHADKCTQIYKKQANEMLHLSLIGPIGFLLVGIISLLSDQKLNVPYSMFTVIYSALCILGVLLFQKYERWMYHELSMPKEQWLILHGKNQDTKKIRKTFFRTSSLLHFLEQESQNGWQVTSIGTCHYTFQYNDSVSYNYTLDSKYYVNKRLRTSGKDTITDKKDFTNLSYDWQLQSVKDASRNTWDFVCAYKNMLVLYRHPSEKQAEPINQNHSLPRAGVFCNKFGIFITCCMLIGFVAGFFAGMLM